LQEDCFQLQLLLLPVPLLLPAPLQRLPHAPLQTLRRAILQLLLPAQLWELAAVDELLGAAGCCLQQTLRAHCY
jgi:hypothetical protein